MSKIMSTTNNVEVSIRRGILMLACLLGAAPVLALELKAELDWARRAELGTPVKGVIQQINAEPGQHVAEGEVLLKLDQRGFKSRVTALQASVAHYTAELAEAEREQERAVELYDRTVLSDHELQVAKNNQVAARARYQEALNELEQAKLDLEYSELRAPYDAVIVSRQAEISQTVIPDLQPVVLFVLADAKHMHARGRANANEIAGLKIGKEAVVKINDKQYTGRIVNFGLLSTQPSEVANNRFFVNVEFPISSQTSLVGQPATIKLP
jgi:multidrug efflux system membrane fusion protein